MTNTKTKEELINRYKYLFENKELILSLCIDKGIRKKYYKNQLATFKKSLSKIKKTSPEKQIIIDLLNLEIEISKAALHTPRYYLMNSIPKEIIKIFEEFLFGDIQIEKTLLYTIIEKIKFDEKKQEEANEKINNLLKRRSHNKFLCNKDCFTVWRILTYVRNKNKDNKAVLDALDKYYNLDRYIATGINWNSGYILLDEDITNNENYLNEITNDFMLDESQTKDEYSAIMLWYEGNEFEQEDEYFALEWSEESEIKPKHNINLTFFMQKLNNIQMIPEEEKKEIYSELQTKKDIKKRVLNINN